MFKNVDAVLFTHVANNFSADYGAGQTQTALVSLEYRFEGETAHSAGAPWSGRSALDAVELMNAGWNYRREHLRQAARVHYVISNGGDQPNVVPRNASVWYYLREADYAHVMDLWKISDDMARAAALMTGTTFTSRLLGSAWAGHFNQPIAEAAYENIKRVGLPAWTEDDQKLARALQRELKAPERGLPDKVDEQRGGGAISEADRTMGPRGGGSDDIGDVSWNVPTITLRYPANVSGTPGHNWANAIAMATPIAHKGVIAGAKVQALTMLDLLMKPELVNKAWDYFRNVQTKDTKYQSFLRPDDKPVIEMNAPIMERYREQLKKMYYDPAKYDTYLEQLGIKYPTVR
jgi:aminobenzoyl-glutamate utilization protein B